MRYSLVLLLLLVVVYTALALSDREKTAIISLRNSLPSLSTASPPWTEDPSAACGTPSFYGLSCSSGPDPHVTSLYEPDLKLLI